LEQSGNSLDTDDGAVLPQEATEHVERDAVVRAALLILSPERRQILTAKYVDGQSVDQIADETGKSPKAVESLLSRARAELRSLLRWYFVESAEGK
jgi:RNA polymerase sigma factor (sigma-70 family)